MDNPNQVKEARASYSTPVADLSHPIILERDGQPVAVLMGIEEYERYQALLGEHQRVSALVKPVVRQTALYSATWSAAR